MWVYCKLVCTTCERVTTFFENKCEHEFSACRTHVVFVCHAARQYDLMFAAMRACIILFFTALDCLGMLVSDTV